MRPLAVARSRYRERGPFRKKRTPIGDATACVSWGEIINTSAFARNSPGSLCSGRFRHVHRAHIRFLPELIDLVWNRKINPRKVFDLTLPLDQVAEGYRAMDERRAIKTLLCP